MKVKAKTNIKYGLGWYAPGEVFDAEDSDLAELGSMVEAVGERPAARPARVKQEEKKAEPEEKKPIEESAAEEQKQEEPKREPARATAARKRK